MTLNSLSSSNSVRKGHNKLRSRLANHVRQTKYLASGSYLFFRVMVDSSLRMSCNTGHEHFCRKSLMNIPRLNRAASNASGQPSAMRVVSLRTGEALFPQRDQVRKYSVWLVLGGPPSFGKCLLACTQQRLLSSQTSNAASAMRICLLSHKNCNREGSQRGCRCPLGHML